MAVSFPTPLVLCDIGGTNTRVAAVRTPGGALEMLSRIRTDDFPTFELALADLCSRAGIVPKSLVLCGAGPVVGKHLALTNAGWTLDGNALKKHFGLAQGLLLNDFEAQALALPVIDRTHALMIGPDLPVDSGPRLILGPGTGLGVAALLQTGGTFAAVPTEAGHVGFGPAHPDEEAIWPHLERAHGRHTAESVLSGPGLGRLHQARVVKHGLKSTAKSAADVTRAAVAEPSGPEADTVRMFWRLIGRFAGDMAITFAATGGVTLAGGILPRIRSLVDEAEFRSQFEEKEPVAELARRIPTRLLIESDAVLGGMAAIAFKPAAYAIDYGQRAWSEATSGGV
jgi:glucokinase